MKSISALIALVLLMVIGGCKSNSPAGHWKGALQGDLANNPLAGTAGSVTLDIKDDKTFTMTMGMAFSGTWTQSGDTLTLAQSTNGKEETQVFTVSSDGSTLTPKDAGSSATAFVFKRG